MAKKFEVVTFNNVKWLGVKVCGLNMIERYKICHFTLSYLLHYRSNVKFSITAVKAIWHVHWASMPAHRDIKHFIST